MIGQHRALLSAGLPCEPATRLPRAYGIADKVGKLGKLVPMRSAPSSRGAPSRAAIAITRNPSIGL